MATKMSAVRKKPAKKKGGGFGSVMTEKKGGGFGRKVK